MLYQRKLLRLLQFYPALLAMPIFSGAQLLGLSYGFNLIFLPVLLYPVVRRLVLGKKFALGAVALALFGVVSGAWTNTASFDPVWGSSETLIGEVLERPRRRSVGRVEVALLAKPYWRENASASKPDSRSRKVLCQGVELPWKNINAIKKGDRVIFRGRFRALQYGELLSYDASMLRKGYLATCKFSYVTRLAKPDDQLSAIERLRYKIIKAVTAVVDDGERAALFLSMSIGISDRSSEKTERGFKRTGLAHLLVVSGYQVTLVFLTVTLLVSGIFRIFPALYLSLNYSLTSSLTGLFVTFLFVQLVGLEGATLRAALAAVFSSSMLLFEKNVRRSQALCAVLLVINALTPGAILDPGMELSFAALFGLAIGSSLAQGKLAQYLFSSTLATFFTGLVSYFWFGTFPMLGFVLNPILAPLLSFLACHLGAVGLGVYFLGIDGDGSLLKLVIDVIWFFGEWIRGFG